MTGLFWYTDTVNNNYPKLINILIVFVSKRINLVFSNQRNGWDFALFTSACSSLKHVELIKAKKLKACHQHEMNDTQWIVIYGSGTLTTSL